MKFENVLLILSGVCIIIICINSMIIDFERSYLPSYWIIYGFLLGYGIAILGVGLYD